MHSSFAFLVICFLISFACFKIGLLGFVLFLILLEFLVSYGYLVFCLLYDGITFT